MSNYLPADPRATAIGFGAVFLWGMSALTVHLTRGLPPFEMLAICFALGGALLVAWGRLRLGSYAFLRQPWHYYVFTTLLVFLNNAGFVLGLRNAPIVAASLINYLWPILIVLFSVPVLGRPLRWWHMGGALLGFGGCAWLITNGGTAPFSFYGEHLPGYLCALTAAVTWTVYSLVSKRYYPQVPTQALGPVFWGVALLSACTYPAGQMVPGLFNIAWRMPQGLEITGLLISGMGTLMLAYACWDYGAKKGDVRAMGAGSYLTPLLSTTVLAVLGDTQVDANAWIACLMVIAGAFLGSARELFGSRLMRV